MVESLRADSANLVGIVKGSAVFVLDYRLAPENPYPAAIEDCVAAYEALLSQGFDGDRLAIVGDSAGGGLALALLIAVRDANLPLPASAVLWSPWLDLACAGTSMEVKAAADVSLNRRGLLHAGRAYVQGDGRPRGLAAPLEACLDGLPPLLIQVGSAEILLSDATRLADACALADTPVRLDVWKGMPHVWQAFFPMLEEARSAITQAADYVQSHWRRS